MVQVHASVCSFVEFVCCSPCMNTVNSLLKEKMTTGQFIYKVKLEYEIVLFVTNIITAKSFFVINFCFTFSDFSLWFYSLSITYHNGNNILPSTYTSTQL